MAKVVIAGMVDRAPERREQTLIQHLAAPSYVNTLAHLGTVGIQTAMTRKDRIDLDEAGKPRGDFVTA